MYRLPRSSTTLLLVAALGMGLTPAGACKSAPTRQPAVPVAGKSDVELLYDAAVVSFRERDLEIDVASKKHRIVTSSYEKVSERLRRRFTARVIRLSRGASGLRVRVEHQRRYGTGEEAVWKKVESSVLKERAEEAELKLGRAIERRYRRWKDYREEHLDAGTDGAAA